MAHTLQDENNIVPGISLLQELQNNTVIGDLFGRPSMSALRLFLLNLIVIFFLVRLRRREIRGGRHRPGVGQNIRFI